MIEKCKQCGQEIPEGYSNDEYIFVKKYLLLFMIVCCFLAFPLTIIYEWLTPCYPYNRKSLQEVVEEHKKEISSFFRDTKIFKDK